MPDRRADTSVRCGAPATSCLLLADLAVNFARSIVSSAGPLIRKRCAYLTEHLMRTHFAAESAVPILLAGSSHMLFIAT